MSTKQKINRLAVDIGGTFTDIALDTGHHLHTCKVLTTPLAPEHGVLNGIERLLDETSLSYSSIDFIIHGTTLATNTIIERKGARTALIVTQGFRDSVEMGYEHRFEQYDIYIDKPEPLVQRNFRLPVKERIDASGKILMQLDENSVHTLVPKLRDTRIESIAVALIHGYANPIHERKIAKILTKELPGISISLASEVCPEIREYERMSTTVANAYVLPLISTYLHKLNDRLQDNGLRCPLYLMTSGGGLATVNTATRFPIRLVESGPAGGAILACNIAAECSLNRVLSFDMGGTTAKICLIDDKKPLTSRTFEVDRRYRFVKGSGLPLRIPVIEMVEIGAGGGSIATVDEMLRIKVGPDSAGADPGPSCYDRGGKQPTVTDADLILGRIIPNAFAGGSLHLISRRARDAISKTIGSLLDIDAPLGAFAVSEVVDENMANAARVHAVEQGKNTNERSLIAFGGAAPIHACRLAEKLSINHIIVPKGAGVGSALGFLKAPVSFEVVKSRYTRLNGLDIAEINALLEEMTEEAATIVEQGAPGQSFKERRIAYMRYIGQGHEIVVELPARPLKKNDLQTLKGSFDAAYAAQFGRIIPDMEIEVLTWSVAISTEILPPKSTEKIQCRDNVHAYSKTQLFDPDWAKYIEAPTYWRKDLSLDGHINGPALILEDQTTTVVTRHFNVKVDLVGHLHLHRKKKEEDATL